MSQRDSAARTPQFYEELAGDYDLLVSWDARLSREKDFLLGVCREIGAVSALDAACGTGMHAVWLARQGLAVAGADASAAMIARAQENAATAGVCVDLRVAGFGALARELSSRFDLVTCLGNSLPHLLDDAALAAALEDFAAVCAPNAALVIQNRNYDRLLREKSRFMPVAARSAGDDETLFLRITDFRADAGDIVDFTVVTLKKRGGVWSQSERTTPLRALRRGVLEAALRAAGFGRLDFFGAFDSSPFDERSSPDLLIVARR